MKASPSHANSRSTKRILIVDDHPLTRHGISHLLNHEKDLSVCGEAENAQQALSMVQSHHPDLIIADLTLPSKSGLEFVKDLKALHPKLPVLVLSMHDENTFAGRLLRAGARGYIMKSEAGEHLLTAVREVLQGRIYVSRDLSLNLFNHYLGNHTRQDRDSLSDLSDREFEIFQLIGRGLSTAEIAQRLCISAKTVESHRIHLKGKLQLKTATELTSRAVSWAASNHLV